MYSVSNEFKTAIAQLDRTINAYVVIDGTTYNSDSVISLNYSHGVLGDRFEVGQAPSAYCEIKLKDIGQIVDNKEVQVFVGVQVSGVFQYVPLGVFIVDESSRIKNELTIHCQDKMVQLEQEYISTLTYPAQLSSVLGEVLSGFTHSITLPSYLSNYTVPKIVKRTKRQVLGYIAAVCGAFAYVDREGVFKFKVNAVNPEVSYVQSISGAEYFKFQREDVQYKVRGLKLSDGTNVWEKDSEAIYAGTLHTNEQALPQVLAERKFTLWIQSPYAADSIRNGLYQQVYQLPTLTYSCEWIGNPAIELGDNIHINEFINEGITTDLYVNIGSVSLRYDGGLSGVLGGVGEGKQRNTFATNGDIASAIEVVQADVSTVQEDVTILKDDVATLETDVATANTNAGNALTAANGKNKIYYQSTAPTGTFNVGDTWFDTDDDHKPYRWNGTTWAGLVYGMNALGELSASKITSGTIDASVITVNNLSASNIKSGTFSTNLFNAGTEGSGYAEFKKTELNFLPNGTTTPYFKLFANSSNGILKWNDGSVTSQVSLGTNAELRSQGTAQLYSGGNVVSVTSSGASINTGLSVSGAISEQGTSLGAKYASIALVSNYLPLSGGTLTGTLYGTGVSLTGNMYASGNLWSVGAYSNIISTRQVYINSSGSFGTTASTERFKQNIIPYKFDYDKLMCLEVVKFNYKPEISDSTETQYGVIAEQAEAIGLDEFVGYDADGQVDYFAYERLAVANLQLIQKQNEMIKRLEERIAILEGAN